MTVATVSAFDLPALIAHLTSSTPTQWCRAPGKELGFGMHFFRGPDRLHANILIRDDAITVDIVRVGRIGQPPKVELHYTSNAAFLEQQQDGAFAITAPAG